MFIFTNRSPAWSTRLFLWIAVLFCLAPGQLLMAGDPPMVDTVYLKNGGTLQGTAEEITENKQRFLLVTTTNGAVVKLRKSQVSHVQRPSEAMQEYLELKRAMPDTVDAHWNMQQWCLDNNRRDPGLADRREYHLLRIIEIEPDHADARARLGHKDIDGVWVHWDHFMLNQGYVKDARGVQRLPQAIAMNERQEAGELVVKEWNKTLRNLLSRINKRNDPDAWKELQSIQDPAAVPGLMKLYAEQGQRADIMKLIIDLIGSIQAGVSQDALVTIATTEDDLDLAERAVNMLQQPHFDRDTIVRTVIHWLNPAASSSTKSNVRVNRAAWLIGRMEYSGATRELIDALVTVHVIPSGAAGGNMNFSSGPDGIGFSPGQKKQVVTQPFENKSVLDTLRLVTPGGVDFGYDEDAWMDWYIRQNTMPAGLLGRDQ